jgi:hypothetical protein
MVKKTVKVNASPEDVFQHVDDIMNVGQHMSERSMVLMGKSSNSASWMVEGASGQCMLERERSLGCR